MESSYAPVSRRMLGRLALGASLASLAPCRVIGAPAPAPRFSVMAWVLDRGLSFDRQLDIISRAGYQGIELTNEFRNWSPADLAGAASRIKSHGLVVDAMAGVRTGFARLDETAQFLAELSQTIASARVLGCRRIILVSGAIPKSMPPAQQQAGIVKALQQAADLAATASIELVIEPIDPFENPSAFLTGARQAGEILRQAGRPNLKILFDIFHEQRAYGNVLETLELLVKDIALIHIADSPKRGAPGTGELNFTAIYAALARLNYSDWIAMEFYPHGDPVPSLDMARREAIQALKPLPMSMPISRQP